MAEIIKGYTTEKELMRKGLRVTALAREDSSGRKVVVKAFTLPPGEAAANAARARHQNLVEKYQKLSGEEFVPLLSWGEKDGKLYLVREHADGITLSEVLGIVQRLPVELAGLLFEEITEAVEKAHAEGISHLDLAQANIVFRQDGKLVFTDWVKEEEGAPAGPGGGQVQKFWQQADQNLDLFALGVLFAKTLVGETALGPEASEAEVVVQLSQRLKEDPGIPQRIGEIIHKLLGEEFERYDGAEEVHATLNDYLKKLGNFDPREAWQRFLAGPQAFVTQLNQWKAVQIAKGAKDLLLAGKAEEAKAEFKKALALDPTSSEAEAQLELLGVKETPPVEKITAPSKPAAKPARPDIFEKLRTSEAPGVSAAPPSKADIPAAPVPPVPEAGKELFSPQEEREPDRELVITSGMEWDQAIPASPELQAEVEPLVSKESEIFAPIPASPEPQTDVVPLVSQGIEIFAPIPVSPEPQTDIEPPASKESEIFASHTPVPVVVTEEESKPLPAPKAGGILTGAQALVIPEAVEPRAEEAHVSVADAAVEHNLPLAPVIEKPGDEDGRGAIGFEKAAPEQPAEEAAQAPGDGMGALGLTSQMGAREYVNQAREGRRLPWKPFVLIALAVVVVLGVVFGLKALNKPKEQEKDSQALYQEGLRAQEVGDFDRALAKFAQVAKGYPQSPEARLAMSSAADLEWRLGKQDLALGHYQMVASGRADDSLGREARFHRALILREQKKASEALTELAGFITDTTEANRAIEAKIVAAQLLHEQGMADSSLTVYSLALDQDRGRVYAVELHKERGLIREEKGDWKAARDDYDAILGMTQPSDLSHVWAEQKASAMAVKMMEKGR